MGLAGGCVCGAPRRASGACGCSDGAFRVHFRALLLRCYVLFRFKIAFRSAVRVFGRAPGLCMPDRRAPRAAARAQHWGDRRRVAGAVREHSAMVRRVGEELEGAGVTGLILVRDRLV